MWIIMALLSALLAATRRTNEKRLTTDLHHLTIGWMTQACALPVIFVALLVHGKILNPLHLGLPFWLPLIGLSIGFYPLNTYLYLRAIRHGDLSNVLPLQSLWPVFSLLPGWLFLHETPSPLSLCGIVLIVLGVYVLGMKGRALHHPWQPFLEDKSSLYMLLAVVLVTVAGIVDKIAIRASEAIYYSFASTVGAVVVMGGLACIYGIREGTMLKSKVRDISLIGTLQGGSYTSYLIALSLGPVAYVSAVRGSNVLIGSLLGIILLKEKFTVNKRVSFALIAAGGLLLALGS